MTVVPFPSLSDVDVQWLELRRQRAEIRRQTALINNNNNNNNQTGESKDDDIQTK